MALQTTSELLLPVNVMVQQRLLRVARARCPYFLGTMPGTIREHVGTFTVKWRRIDELTPTTTALAELTGAYSLPTRTGSQATITDVTATIAKFGDFIYLTDEADLGNFSSHVDGLANALGIQAGRSLNRLQRNIGEDNATLIRPAGVSADSDVADPIGLNLIELATNTLEGNSSVMFTPMTTGDQSFETRPVMPAFWGLCHTHVKPDIRKISGFVGAEKYAGQTNIGMGEFGMVGDTRWISTPEASVDTDIGGAAGGSLRSTSGTAVDLYTSLIFGEDAIGSVGFGLSHVKEVYLAGDNLPAVEMIAKPKGSAGTGDPLNEVSSIAWKARWAGAVLNANFVRGLRHGATNLE
jgi:N4-gp56 family major capsid protein